MDIKRIILSYLDANCYIISIGKKCLIVDPGWDKDVIIREVKDKKVLGILVTHYHPDHVGALEDIIKEYNVNVYNYKSEEKVKLDKFSFEIIKTYGHTDDSVTFYFPKEKIMFTGDFLCKETIGRADLPTGDNNKMYDSLKKIKKYSDDITIFPGHGEDSTLGYEKKNNIFLNE